MQILASFSLFCKGVANPERCAKTGHEKEGNDKWNESQSLADRMCHQQYRAELAGQIHVPVIHEPFQPQSLGFLPRKLAGEPGEPIQGVLM